MTEFFDAGSAPVCEACDRRMVLIYGPVGNSPVWQLRAWLCETCGSQADVEQEAGEPENTAPNGAASVEDTLNQRGERYGEFACHAAISQQMKGQMRASPGWGRLADDQREALEMVVHKIARILNGDPNYHDSWHDIF